MRSVLTLWIFVAVLSAAKEKRTKQIEPAWLAGAAMVHLLLLLVPLQRDRTPVNPVLSPGQPIVIELHHRSPREVPVERTAPPVEVTAAPGIVRNVDSKKPSNPSDPAPVKPVSRLVKRLPGPSPAAAQAEAEPGDHPVTVATLFDSIRQLSGTPQESDLHDDSRKRRLGQAMHSSRPANWSEGAGAGLLQQSPNRFHGMHAPASVEIVDRWLAADGSHNVVVNLPNGSTLCGNAQAWNPMQPLVEHVMLFRPCGGGGKRTFSMPTRTTDIAQDG